MGITGNGLMLQGGSFIAGYVPTPAVAGIVTTGLRLYLDAGNAASYPGAGNTWFDLSGNNFNAALVNSPTYNASNSGSIVFNGSNQYANDGASIQVTRPFSLNCWINFNGLAAFQTFVGQDTPQPIALAAFYFQKVSNTPPGDGRAANTVGLALINTAGTAAYCYDTVPVTTGVWYNYCAVASPTQILLYRNGTLITTVNDNTTMASTTGNLLIGTGYYASNIADYTNGKMSMTLAYNIALTQAQVTQNYNAIKARYGL